MKHPIIPLFNIPIKGVDIFESQLKTNLVPNRAVTITFAIKFTGLNRKLYIATYILNDKLCK